MAAQHSSPALRAPEVPAPYRAARTGYGKQSIPAQGASLPSDFAALPERERYVAGYLDRLPDGAAMDIKSLAKDLPLYGQMAIGTALRALAVAGHLRRVRRRVDVEGDGRCRWVTYTYWSRTAHDNEWWTARLAGGGPADPAPSAEPRDVPPERPAPNPPAPLRQDAPSPAYLALAGLGRREPRLALSAADCATLEPLAAAWLARGVDVTHLTQALTAGLPEAVAFPLGLVRRRLVDKMPPQLPDAPPAGRPAPDLRVECVECGRPGPPEALPDGLCGPCRTPYPQVSPDRAVDVTARIAGLRDLMRTP
ncbi:MarR family transcriptional regulator [Streptomyces sp. NBC_01423]|uniref:MarR family transcriptional regulator n=1 Tax=Streptomyces sp. NBC_01423 TaxID=2903860 RepID=UPI002E2880BD|nr:MarR family transcriptional regulator [Streptomyces sp. NBC_01423]